MKRSRSPSKHPGDWRDPDELEYLYDGLGWTLTDIVEHFADLGSEDISEGRVRRMLDRHDIRCGRNDRPPVQGPGAALWNSDSIEDAVGGGD